MNSKTFCFAILITALISFTGCRTSVPVAAHPSGNNYVLVHGAWGGGWDWRQVDDLLTADGNKVFRATLTGQGERAHLSNTNIDLETHIEDVVNLIVWENLHDVVLVGHSYGGMVITGVADRVPDRIKQLVYVDALLPENGQSVLTAIPGRNVRQAVTNGYILPVWVTGNPPPPHDVPMPALTFSQPITLTNQANAAAIHALYILTVDKGRAPEQDGFYQFYQRAQARGWPSEIMEGDHNVQRSHPKELVHLLEQASH
ncbi:MAG TPA: alpha/beta hydrolase family protein [Verrucomicrobiae bacterium]|nr:alpha/beta hydrolase family protein [Verrucomicrobiae bacterium]